MAGHSRCDYVTSVPGNVMGILALKNKSNFLCLLHNLWTKSLSYMTEFTINNRVIFTRSKIELLSSLIIVLSLGWPIACSRLSDSWGDAKAKGTRKVGGAGKKEKGREPPPLLSPVSSRFIFVFALSQFSVPD